MKKRTYKKLTYNDMVNAGVPVPVAECFTTSIDDFCDIRLNDDGTVECEDWYGIEVFTNLKQFVRSTVKMFREWTLEEKF